MSRVLRQSARRRHNPDRSAPPWFRSARQEHVDAASSVFRKQADRTEQNRGIRMAGQHHGNGAYHSMGDRDSNSACLGLLLQPIQQRRCSDRHGAVDVRLTRRLPCSRRKLSKARRMGIRSEGNVLHQSRSREVDRSYPMEPISDTSPTPGDDLRQALAGGMSLIGRLLTRGEVQVVSDW